VDLRPHVGLWTLPKLGPLNTPEKPDNTKDIEFPYISYENKTYEQQAVSRLLDTHRENIQMIAIYG